MSVHKTTAGVGCKREIAGVRGGPSEAWWPDSREAVTRPSLRAEAGAGARVASQRAGDRTSEDAGLAEASRRSGRLPGFTDAAAPSRAATGLRHHAHALRDRLAALQQAHQVDPGAHPEGAVVESVEVLASPLPAHVMTRDDPARAVPELEARGPRVGEREHDQDVEPGGVGNRPAQRQHARWDLAPARHRDRGLAELALSAALDDAQHVAVLDPLGHTGVLVLEAVVRVRRDAADGHPRSKA